MDFLRYDMATNVLTAIFAGATNAIHTLTSGNHKVGYVKLGAMKQLFFELKLGGEVGGGQAYLLSPVEELHFQNLKQVNSNSSLSKATSKSNFMIFIFPK